jgi:predicted NAD-dependent protein-ADP-ribosyltransferase YbiA (DUF1768 family)
MGKSKAKLPPDRLRGRRMKNVDYRYFSAAAKLPWAALSNLCYCREGVCRNGLVFPSAEHAYQAEKFGESERGRFAIGGDLADWGSLRYFFRRKHRAKETEAEWAERLAKKKKHWSKKKMVGILAKMASKPEHAKSAGLSAPKHVRQGIFYKLLRSKFERDEELLSVLLSTGSAHLIEFARGAKRREDLGGAPERWAGNVTDGVLYGDNRMGAAMMLTREFFQLQQSDA